MTKRKYGYWGTIGSASYAGGDTGVPGWITAAYEGSRANDITYLYANERHNILNVQYHGAASRSADSTDYVVTPNSIAGEAEDSWQGVYSFYKAPVNLRMAYPGNLRVWFLCKSSSENAVAGIRVTATAPYAISVSTVIHSSTTTWYSLDLTLPEVDPRQTYPIDYRNQNGNNLCLFADIAPAKANYLTVYSVCAYQRQTASTPVHVQLDAATNSIGDNDKPMSQAVAKLLQDETNCQYAQRMPRSNVAAHWFPPYYKATTLASYPANVGVFGEYKFVKRSGCSAIYTYYCVNNNASDPTSEWTLKTTIASTVEGFQEIADIRRNGVHYWVGSKFTFSTANTAIEKELTLQLCNKLSNTSGALASLWGVCVTEKPPSTTSLSHVVPDASQYVVGEYLLASQVEDERATLTHLWKRQPAIALSDWRQTITGYPNLVRCTTTTYSKKEPLVLYGGSQTSLIARALAWPSYGCSRIRITMGFQTYLSLNAPEESSNTKKAILFQLSDSTVNATAIWAGPTTYTDTSGNVQQSYYEGYFNVADWMYIDAGAGFKADRWVDYAMGHYGNQKQMNLRANTTVVSSARWLSPTSTISAPSVLNPLQVWVFAWTAATADYVAPTYISIEEVPLTEGEFP